MLELINKIEQGLSQDEYYHLLAEADCAIVETNLPMKCRGLVASDDGGFIIYINSQLPEDKKRKTLKHEFMHLYHDHFMIEIDVKEKERGVCDAFIG